MWILTVVAVIVFVIVMAKKSKPAKESHTPAKAADPVPAAPKEPEKEPDPRWTETPDAPADGKYPEDYLAELKAQQEERQAAGAHYKYVVLDFETTGLVSTEDDILQVAIIDDKDNVLINQKCRPGTVTDWQEAAEINDIWPKDVAFCPTFEQTAVYVQDILSRATKIVAYNREFEQDFLEGYDIDPKQYKWAQDPMKLAAQYYNVQKGSTRRAVKLSVISKMLGYKYHAHDALEDVKATRYVYDTLTEWVKRQRAEAKVSRVDT